MPSRAMPRPSLRRAPAVRLQTLTRSSWRTCRCASISAPRHAARADHHQVPRIAAGEACLAAYADAPAVRRAVELLAVEERERHPVARVE